MGILDVDSIDRVNGDICGYLSRMQWYSGTIEARIKFKNEKELVEQILTVVLLALFIFCIFWYHVKIIVIDTMNKTIFVKNIVLRSSKTYSFSEFDGYFDSTTQHVNIGSRYDTVGLIKNNEVFWKIDGYFYSNVEELKSGLKDLKYFGFIKFDFWGNPKK